jgi:hypothetical protein
MEEKVLVDSAQRAFAIAKDLAGRGYRPRSRVLRMDVYMADPQTKAWIRVMRRAGLKEAAVFAYRWSKFDREIGCVLWPSEADIPRKWRVVRST